MQDPYVDKINESNNDPSYSMYIVSDDYLGDKKQLSPKIPKDSLTRKGIKNKEVPRVPFYPSIKQALIAGGDNINEKREMFVHVPVEGQKVKAQKPTSNDVPDVGNTGEIWVKEPIKVKCIGKIRIGKEGKPVEFEADGKKFTHHTWNYSWLTKQDKHVQNDYVDKKAEEKEKQEEEEDKLAESFLTEDALPLLENGLNLGDKIMMFGEDAKYDAQLRRILYNDRLRQRKDLLEIYDKVKADNPWIKYTYPDIKRYQLRNLFIDTYYYTSIFFSNNTWTLKKGLGLYLDFMTRLIHNKEVEASGYNMKAIMIPLDAWDKKHDGSVWNFKVSLNPLSVMYQLMFTMDLKSLRKVFGNLDILIVGKDKYFKINFSEIEDKEAKKVATKFKSFLIKMSKDEVFDPEDIDTTSDFKDSPEVVKAKVIDKIEDTKGVDITPEVYKASKAKKSTKEESDTKTAAQRKEEEKEDNTIDPNLTLASQSKDEKSKLDNSNQDKKEQIARNIVDIVEPDEEEQAYRNNQPTEEDLFNDLDDETKMNLLTLEPEDNTINISAARAKRLSDLDRKVLDSTIKGMTINDILNDNRNSEVVTTKLDIADPTGEFEALTYINFDKNYNVDRDIIACFRHFANTSVPVVAKKIEVTDNSTSEDRVELYRVEMEDFSGKRFTIKLDIPVEKDNRYLLRGNYKSIQTQLFTMPILKVDLNSAQLVSNYSKIILSRFKSGNGRSMPLTAQLLKAIDKYNGSKIKFTTGDNSKICNKYDLPVDYIDLSSYISKIETSKEIIYTNQDELRAKYQVDDSKGIPIGYDKQNKSVIYLTDDIGTPFTDVVFCICKDAEPSFEDLVLSMAKPSACTYTRAKVMSVEIPLVVICAYHEGLRTCMDKGAIEYEIVNNLTKDIRNNYIKDWIKFSDGYVVYKVTQESSLFMNGLKDCDTSSYPLSEMDSKNMYLEFLDNYGGRIKADGLDNFYNLMMDPMTVESLKYYHLPTDYIQALIYANNLLADNKFIKHTETATKRFRRKQLIAVYTYKVLSSAYSAYCNQVKHGAPGAARMVVKQSDVIDAFLTDSITSDDSVINALRDIETTNGVTTKGPSGMNSQRAYSLDKRTYDDSMLNVFGISTGFSGNVGITRQATLNANITPDGYTKVINGDTSQMNTANTLTATEALIPFGSTHDDPMRTAMAFIQTAKHQVRTVDSDPCLVVNGAHEALPYMSTDRFAFKSKKKGKVEAITDEYILLAYDDGTKDIVSLIERIEKNSDGGYFVPLKLDPVSGMKVGKTFKAGEIMAYDKESYSNELGETGNLAYSTGKLCKVAVLNSDEGFEDSGIVTASLAQALATRVDYQFPVTLDKETIVYSIAKVGQHVEVGDPLLVWQNPFEDQDANAIMKSFAMDNEDISELGKRTLRSEITGTVKGIKIFRTVELDELSDSLKKIVNNYEKPYREMEKIVKANNLDISDVPAHYKLDTVGKLKKAENSVVIEFYVEYLDTVGVGDKVTAFSGNKMVIHAHIPDELAPFVDSRPNEPISSILSVTSLNKRLICGSVIFGSITRLMIELDRHVKDIMGIPYDDSTM